VRALEPVYVFRHRRRLGVDLLPLGGLGRLVTGDRAVIGDDRQVGHLDDVDAIRERWIGLGDRCVGRPCPGHRERNWHGRNRAQQPSLHVSPVEVSPEHGAVRSTP
jgi:hypothetical protein